MSIYIIIDTDTDTGVDIYIYIIYIILGSLDQGSLFPVPKSLGEGMRRCEVDPPRTEMQAKRQD